MTDKERLEVINNFSSLPLKKRISLTKESIKKELKANDYHMPKNININTQYLLEIIEQAERAQWLEKELKHQTEHFSISFDLLENQNKHYREALKNIYELAEYDEYDNTLERIVSEIEKTLEGGK